MHMDIHQSRRCRQSLCLDYLLILPLRVLQPGAPSAPLVRRKYPGNPVSVQNHIRLYIQPFCGSPEDLLGRTIFLGPGEEVSLKDGAGNPVDIRAFKSTDQGVAFLASLEGQDHLPCRGFKQLGMGRGAGGRQPQDGENFHREMDKLAGRHIDVAFMLIDPRQEKDFYLGMDDFYENGGGGRGVSHAFLGGLSGGCQI